MIHPLTIPTYFPYTTLFRSLERLLDGLPTDGDLVRASFRPDRGGRRELLAWQRIGLAGHAGRHGRDRQDRKSTRLNSSHLVISYAVFCLKKKTLSFITNFNL